MQQTHMHTAVTDRADSQNNYSLIKGNRSIVYWLGGRVWILFPFHNPTTINNFTIMANAMNMTDINDFALNSDVLQFQKHSFIFLCA